MLANLFFRAGRRIVAIAGLAIALSACGLLDVNPGSQILSSQFQSQDGDFVRIERIEPGAPDNAHPVAVSVDALRPILANLKVKGSISRDAEPVFTSRELDEIMPPLVAALAKAGPREDIAFAASDGHGQFGKYSPRLVTTGRVFVLGTTLNIIFGRVHEPYDRSAVATLYIPGSRVQRIEGVWSLVPENARLADHRSDWLIIDTALLPAQKEKADGRAATPAAPAPDSRYQDIENKLRTLDRLKADGLITEEEYRERRRAILQGI